MKKKKGIFRGWVVRKLIPFIDLLVRNQFMRKKSRVCILKKKRRVYRGVCEKKNRVTERMELVKQWKIFRSDFYLTSLLEPPLTVRIFHDWKKIFILLAACVHRNTLENIKKQYNNTNEFKQSRYLKKNETLYRTLKNF